MKVDLTQLELVHIATALLGEQSKQLGLGNRQRAEEVAKLQDKINAAIAKAALEEQRKS